MKISKYIVFFPVLICLTSCKEDHHPPEGRPVAYFDLKSLVEADIKTLSSKECGLKKEVTIDGKTQEQLLPDADFRMELEPLLDCDINKAGWSDKFSVDSSVMHGEKLLTYSTQSDKVKIKWMQVFMDSDQTVTRVAIKKSIRTFSFSFDSDITYYPGKGYAIQSSQKAFLIHTFALQLHATFECKP